MSVGSDEIEIEERTFRSKWGKDLKDTLERNPKMLENKNRLMIYDYIVKNPGCTITQIMKGLELTRNNTRYHLEILEKNDRILLTRYNYIYRVYPSKYRRTVLSFLNQMEEKILKLLERRGNLDQREIKERLGISQPTISRMLDRLIKKKMIVRDIIMNKYVY
jgi:predicted transcriptional regulator